MNSQMSFSLIFMRLSNMEFLYLILTRQKFTACIKARHEHELKCFTSVVEHL